MAESIIPGDAVDSTTGSKASKDRFTKALDEARAGVKELGKEAQERADLYKDKASAASNEWLNEARARGGQAKEKATTLATEGKTKASEAMVGLGKMVEDNAAMIDEKLGAKYGDYARSAAQSINSAAQKLDAKDIGELGDDAREFVRKSPGVAIGVAAVAGFMIARLFRGSNN